MISALPRQPVTVSARLQQAWLETIFPQPHDMRFGAIATEAGLQSSE